MLSPMQLAEGQYSLAPANNASLAASHSLYSQATAANNINKPERPTYIKDVSVAPGPMLRYHSASYLQ